MEDRDTPGPLERGSSPVGRHRGGRSWKWLWWANPRPLFLVIVLVFGLIVQGVDLLRRLNLVGLIFVLAPFAIMGAAVWLLRRGGRPR